MKKHLFLFLVLLAMSFSAGCEVILNSIMENNNARFSRPVTVKVKTVKCGPACSDVIAAAKLEPSHLKTTTFKQIADRPNLTAHEQMHLIDALMGLEYGTRHSHWEPEDVLHILSLNKTLTHSGKRYFSENLNQFAVSSSRERDIIKALTNNPGVSDPPEAGVEYVEYTLDDIEIIWCDYYRFDYQVAGELRALGCRIDDVTVAFFLAYHAHQDPVVVGRWYAIQRLPWKTITVNKLRLNPDVFFISTSQPEELGLPYSRAYGQYRNNPGQADLSDNDITDLVELKGLSESCNIPPADIAREKQNGRDVKDQAKDHRRNSPNPNKFKNR